ncbi:MAG: hypothetical protein ABIG67_01685, partial [Pseudomonadota bacterium]
LDHFLPTDWEKNYVYFIQVNGRVLDPCGRHNPCLHAMGISIFKEGPGKAERLPHLFCNPVGALNFSLFLGRKCLWKNNRFRKRAPFVGLQVGHMEFLLFPLGYPGGCYYDLWI